ncbi:hypothetical protein EYF80_026206 [Liparis tanakae]|uniref:Uncharacterized protein n=1 Tax=Liparis tanakae TaxID=230148 RepID=A0A4Z2HF60_9TELE|nr:hypothetical protein EYF80_026206 [Liparis tanakae]
MVDFSNYLRGGYVLKLDALCRDGRLQRALPEGSLAPGAEGGDRGAVLDDLQTRVGRTPCTLLSADSVPRRLLADSQKQALQTALDKETEKHLKAPVLPLVCVSNLRAGRSAALGNRRSRTPFKGRRRRRRRGGRARQKEPRRYLQEQQRRRRGRRIWAEADTITILLEGATAALQRSQELGHRDLLQLQVENRREIMIHFVASSPGIISLDSWMRPSFLWWLILVYDPSHMHQACRLGLHRFKSNEESLLKLCFAVGNLWRCILSPPRRGQEFGRTQETSMAHSLSFALLCSLLSLCFSLFNIKRMDLKGKDLFS